MPDDILTDDEIALDATIASLPEDQMTEAFITLRDQRKAHLRELRELRPLKPIVEQTQRQAALTAAGLPADLGEKKIAALLAVAGDNKDAEGIKAAAIELGFIQTDPAQAPRAAAAADSQIAAQTAGNSGHVAPLPTLDEQIAAAEKAKDWTTAGRLKLQKLVPASNGLIPA